jgi:hypothetical protein
MIFRYRLAIRFKEANGGTMSGSSFVNKGGKRSYSGKKNRVESGICKDREEPEDITEIDPNDAISEEVDQLTVRYRNHTTPWLVQWSWLYGLLMFIGEIGGMFIVMYTHLNANLWLPGNAGGNQTTRAVMIGAAYFLAKATIGRYTGATLDPIRSIKQTVVFLLTRGKSMGKGKIWVEILKLPIFIIAQFLGAVLALVFFGLTADTDIKTSDCLLAFPTPGVCIAYPVRDVSTTFVSMIWMEAMASLLINGMFSIGETLIRWRYPDIALSAIIYASGVTISHGVFSTASGGSFSFWYWAMTAWFSNISDSENAARVWPATVSCAIVGIIEIAVHYAYRRTGNEYKDATIMTHMTHIA